MRLAIEVGLAGASIEDFAPEPGNRIYDIGLATERVAAAAEAAHAGPGQLVLTARAENYLHGHPDLADTIARLQAYQEAGADVLYAPGLRRLEDISQLVREVDRPVNVLALDDAPPVAELAEAGVAGSRWAARSRSPPWVRSSPPPPNYASRGPTAGGRSAAGAAAAAVLAVNPPAARSADPRHTCGATSEAISARWSRSCRSSTCRYTRSAPISANSASLAATSPGVPPTPFSRKSAGSQPIAAARRRNSASSLPQHTVWATE